jgi:two-component system, LytTR family, sensor kinase
MERKRIVRLLSLAFWTATGLLCGLQIWISMIDHGHALWRVMLYQVLIWNAWFAFTPLVAALARRFPLVPPTPRAVLVHVVAALVLAPVHSVWWTFLLVEMRPYDAMGTRDFGEAIGDIALSGLPLQLVLYCGVLVAHHASDYYEKYRERERALARLEVSLAEARLHALELQIQPHFLFNTLHSISALVRAAQPAEAVTMIAGLAELLRYSLEHAGQQCVALADELAITRRYLEIEQVRFADRMSFALEVAPELERAAVPMLLLQPLAENAIRHGVARRAAPGRVTIRASRDGAELRLDVFNTGTLADEPRAGVGLHNTRERLRHLYGDAHRFVLAPTDGGVLASVCLPYAELA